MIKIILLLSVIATLSVNAQQVKEKNIGGFAGLYTQVNFAEYLEFGALLGVNLKNRALVGLYYQKGLKGNSYSGLYTQVNFNPKCYYFNLGLALRAGLVNGKYLSLEPALTMQWNGKNDSYRIIHQLGITAGFPSYSIGFVFGKFRDKNWENKK